MSDTVTIELQLDAQVYKTLVQMASAKGLTLDALINQILREYLAKAKPCPLSAPAKYMGSLHKTS